MSQNGRRVGLLTSGDLFSFLNTFCSKYFPSVFIFTLLFVFHFTLGSNEQNWYAGARIPCVRDYFLTIKGNSDICLWYLRIVRKARIFKNKF